MLPGTGILRGRDSHATEIYGLLVEEIRISSEILAVFAVNFKQSIQSKFEASSVCQANLKDGASVKWCSAGRVDRGNNDSSPAQTISKQTLFTVQLDIFEPVRSERGSSHHVGAETPSARE